MTSNAILRKVGIMALIRRFEKLDLPDAPLFAGCSRSERRNLSRLGTGITVRPGTTLTPEGKPGREFFVVKEGEASCTRDGAPLAEFSDGDFFGEMALLDGGPRTATITAKTPLAVVVYSCSEFRTLLDTSTPVRCHLMTQLARRLRIANIDP